MKRVLRKCYVFDHSEAERPHFAGESLPLAPQRPRPFSKNNRLSLDGIQDVLQHPSDGVTTPPTDKLPVFGFSTGHENNYTLAAYPTDLCFSASRIRISLLGLPTAEIHGLI